MKTAIKSLVDISRFTVILMGLILLFPEAYAFQDQGDDPAKIKLCVGYYWTESQALSFLDSVARTQKNQSDWLARKAMIESNIIQGAGLSNEDLNHQVPMAEAGITMQLNGYHLRSMRISGADGEWVYGNLYLPCIPGPHALILCPHGHWSNPADYGRFRSDMQKRCAVLARMGAMVFAYDMIGYGETNHLQHKVADALHIQTLNSIKILDYFLSLDEIDPERVSITGASGGGTQSFILTAIDDRIKVAVPAVQVSAHFFGGCVCESGMPIHARDNFQTNNVEIAALAAPRPMLLISDGADWTKNTPNVEYPFIKNIYRFFGAEALVENAHFPLEQHDYGWSKRQAMYRFMINYLGLKKDQILILNGEVQEDFVSLLTYDELKFRQQ